MNSYDWRNAMGFSASEFEFRHRFWLIAGIFFVAFMCYILDPVNVSVALSKIIVASIKPGDPKSIRICIRFCFVFGALLSIAAALVRTWAAAYLHSSVVHDMNLHSDRLVADGPYRHLRNPLYLGVDLLAAGIGFMANRFGIIILVGGIAAFTYRLILREEASLLTSQSEDYRRFFQNVPRLLPSLRPRVPAAGGKANWMDGFTGELFIWGCAVGMALFAATENLAYYGIAMSIGFAIYILQAFTRKKGPGQPNP
jgi:protein-S-isoprenylcysteine O-methyltransferase Ste14